MRQARINAVGHPADKRQAVVSNRLRGQQGVVDTAFLNPHHHEHRQLFLHYPFRKRTQVVHQAAPAAGTFNHYMLNLAAEAQEAIRQQAVVDRATVRHAAFIFA